MYVVIAAKLLHRLLIRQ